MKKKLLENKEMDFKNGVKNIQAAGYTWRAYGNVKSLEGSLTN